MKKSLLLLLTPFALLFAAASFADIDVRNFETDEARDTYQALTRELRCPKCQNQDIADSNAPIAQDMRAQVHRLVEEGKSHEQVVDYMIERFGEFVTYKPKVSSETYLLWYGPWVFVAIGLVAIVAIARKKRMVAHQNDSDAKKGKEDGVSLNSEEPVGPPDQSKSVQALLDKYKED